MYAIRSYYVIDGSEVEGELPHVGLDPGDRLGEGHLRSGLLLSKQFAGADTSSRITSYNVCYTKLLRHRRRDPHGRLRGGARASSDRRHEHRRLARRGNRLRRDLALAPETALFSLLSAHMIIFWLSQDSNVTPPVCP